MCIATRGGEHTRTPPQVGDVSPLSVVSVVSIVLYGWSLGFLELRLKSYKDWFQLQVATFSGKPENTEPHAAMSHSAIL